MYQWSPLAGSAHSVQCKHRRGARWASWLACSQCVASLLEVSVKLPTDPAWAVHAVAQQAGKHLMHASHTYHQVKSNSSWYPSLTVSHPASGQRFQPGPAVIKTDILGDPLRGHVGWPEPVKISLRDRVIVPRH